MSGPGTRLANQRGWYQTPRPDDRHHGGHERKADDKPGAGGAPDAGGDDQQRADFLVQNRYVIAASTEPAVGRHGPDAKVLQIRQRATTPMFGDHPTPAERLSLDVVFLLPKSLPSLIDLTDGEPRETLKTTMLRILRVPS